MKRRDQLERDLVKCEDMRLHAERAARFLGDRSLDEFLDDEPTRLEVAGSTGGASRGCCGLGGYEERKTGHCVFVRDHHALRICPHCRLRSAGKSPGLFPKSPHLSKRPRLWREKTSCN